MTYSIRQVWASALVLLASLLPAVTAGAQGVVVNGSVYGGGNAAGVGTAGGTDFAKVNIETGTIGQGVYGGCNTEGTVNGYTEVNITGGTIGAGSISEGVISYTTAKANVHGGGYGQATIVTGSVTVNIGTSGQTADGATIWGDVYGGSALGHVNGTSANSSATTEVTLNKGTVNGDIYGGGLGQQAQDAQGTAGEDGYKPAVAAVAANVYGIVSVKVAGGSARNVFGCNNLNGAPQQEVSVTMTGGEADNVFGGGQQADAPGQITVSIQGGTVNEAVYGGGALASTNTGFRAVTGLTSGESVVTGYYTESGGNYTLIEASDAKAEEGTSYYAHNTTTVSLTGGRVGDAYGGGLGDATTPAYVWGDVSVTVNGTAFTIAEDPYTETNDAGETVEVKVAKSGRVFGCNNINGTPKGNVTVTVERTVEGSLARTTDVEDSSVTHTYEIAAVYGGGNLAAYEPVIVGTESEANHVHTNVIINGCGNTSIKQVYGGGNAASTPATQVTINGTYEIDEVFGGGNGNDKIKVVSGESVTWDDNPGANVGFYAYDTESADYDTPAKRLTKQYGYGKAQVNIGAGVIHAVYGGSNAKGNVREVAIATLDYEPTDESCHFSVGEAYGGGKSANMDGKAVLQLGCIPSIKEVYGGARHADVNDDVVLTITNGTYDRVFGGNNEGGNINGSITVNVEETGCEPIVIGQLFAAGNAAHYSTPSGKEGPTVNVRSFTSIGEIYGGGYSADVTGDTHVNIAEVLGDKASEDADDDNKTIEFEGHEVVIPEHTTGEIGVIGYVYGGGFGADVIGNTNVNIVTSETVTYITGDQKDVAQTVVGAHILHDVFGGGYGQNTTVTDNVYVNIGGQKEVSTGGGSGDTSGDSGDSSGDASGDSSGDTSGESTGGGEGDGGEGEGTTSPTTTIVYFGEGVTIGGSVYGGSALGAVNAIRSGSGLSAATGKTTEVTLKKGTVTGAVFGGGQGEGNATAGREAKTYGNAVVTLYGDVVAGGLYGGGDVNARLFGNTTLNLYGGIVGAETRHADVFGGGLGAATNVNGNVTVNVGSPDYTGTTSTTIYGNVYGGGALGSVNTSTSNTTIVNLYKGTIYGDVFGGALGQIGQPASGTPGEEGYVEAIPDIPAAVNGAVEVNLNDNDGTCVVTGSIFGCNNNNGSPKGHVLVHVFKTVGSAVKDATKTTIGERWSEDATYDLTAVFGGGNHADYEPTAPAEYAQVIIEGCDETSIETVYGGGNAAATPATQVQVKGAYLINEVFGGGYGAGAGNPGANVGYKTYTNADNKESYGTGRAVVELYGGKVHTVYGGSNTKGNIRTGTSVDKLTDTQVACSLEVRNIYGAGKNADMDAGTVLKIGCIPGLENVYGGAKDANMAGGVDLVITGGTFTNVFGGNDTSGTIQGRIRVFIEESCEPIIIDNLYLGGNLAPYSVYGYYDTGDTNGDKPVYAVRTAADDQITDENATGYKAPIGTTPVPYADPELYVTKFTRIGNVYGGGYGSSAILYGNPTVNVNEVKNLAGNLGQIGNVFGGGDAANIEGSTTVNIGTETVVEMHSLDPVTDGKYPTANAEGAYITGSVFGGGNEANVTGNAKVNICGTQEPDRKSENGYTDTAVDHSETTGFSVSIGESVYGGGKSADVLGNTFVTMADGYVFNGIFGGGYSGSVGTFTKKYNDDVTDWGHTAHDAPDECFGKPTACTSGGTCYVVVSGGQIGPVEVATEGMKRKTNGHGDPVPQGWVWGGGFGLVENPAVDPDTHFRTYVNNTDVTIKGNAFILESIIGGGEFGRVLGNTLVKIQGGQIGVGEGKVVDGKPVPYGDDDFIDPLTTSVTSDNALAECSHFPYGRNIVTDEAPNWVYDTYDPYADLVIGTKPYPGGSTDHASDGKTWIGCVFAGGSGRMPYTIKDDAGNITGYDWVKSAGWVEGNAEVRITGGHILTNVYGGNEYTDVKGKCIVKMSGGTVGVPLTLDDKMKNPMTGNIYGAGKGDPRVHFNKVTNVKEVEMEITGGIIYGSVYGGGEDGHVLRDVKMTIGKADDNTGPVIGTWGTTYVDGNVFGGGRGFSGDAYTAGNVAGCVDLTINGGTILGSVYGGGRLGSVGYGLFDADDTTGRYGSMRPDNTDDDASNSSISDFKRGHIDITINGGIIGNNYEYVYNPSDALKSSTMPLTEFDSDNSLKHTKGGNVFAGGMGRLYQMDGKTPISDVDWWKLGNVKTTTLTITGGNIYSSVYGGGELGMVQGGTHIASDGNAVSTEIYISGGTIGTEVKDDSNVVQYTYGSVFGGGYGSLVEKLTHTQGKNPTYNTYHYTYPKYIAGRVKGSTEVTITGSAEVKASVYGGGEMAAVGESKVLSTSTDAEILGETLTGTDGAVANTYVTVSGGTIGKDKVVSGTTVTYFGGAKMGNVYGGGSGYHNTVRSGHIYGNTNVNITNGTIYHNVYGGGAYGTVGDFTYTTTTESGAPKVTDITGLHTARTGTGTANVTITGGTIGVDGHENGMVFGSSRGDINEPGQRDDYTAWVNNAIVTIGTSDKGFDAPEPQIKGSVYGSGENGHTYGNTTVEVHSGTIGVAGDASYSFRGNVYGGGCGTDTYDVKTGTGDEAVTKTYFNELAGIVRGNTTVTVDGGYVVRNVYGGGAMGSVGVFARGESSDNNMPGEITALTSGGKCTVTISGGKIGPDDMTMPTFAGMVFGAGRGEVHSLTDYPNLERVVYVNNTEVNIEEGAQINGSVYGGAESGHMLGDTEVNINGGTIGNGNVGEGTPCAHWTYDLDGDGKAYDMYDGTTGYNSEGGATTATDGHTFYGNVFGGGSGSTPYAAGQWLESAGVVKGNTVVKISGGHILSNVYGGNECTNVDQSATVTMTGGTVGVSRTADAIAALPTIGHVYGAGKGDKRVLFNTWTNVASTSVNIQGGTVYGSVYGGGEDGHVLGDAVTTIEEATGKSIVIGCSESTDDARWDGNVFGGGQGSASALTAGVVAGNITLDVKSGDIKGSVYGGGRMASVGTYFTDPNAGNYGKLHTDKPENHGNIAVNLTGGTIRRHVFGGGMGTRDTKYDTETHTCDDLGISRNTTVNLNEGVATSTKGCIVLGSIFGCNNTNASPKGHAKVHVFATQNPSTANLLAKVSDSYDIGVVFGGGNQADYVPASDDNTEVIIEGCGLTSIRQVYGGGNAAASPSTLVLVKGTEIIDEVFGGGNGYDPIIVDGVEKVNPGANVGYRTKTSESADLVAYTNGDGKSLVQLMAGTVHNAYGGSNSKGDIRIDSNVTTVENEWRTGDGANAPCCEDLYVDNIFGGGKNADMKGGANIVMGCSNSSRWVKEIYAGSENANVGGNVSLTLTSGKFGRVFGGNKTSGKLEGSITVNIEENGQCGIPLIIGELYGGGNKAEYSVYGYDSSDHILTGGTQKFANPQVNVRAFTSIGNIFGGGYGEEAVMYGSPTVNINEVLNHSADATSYSGNAYSGETLNYVNDMLVIGALPEGAVPYMVTLPAHEDGKIGAIGNVYGGGNAAEVHGDTNLNIGTTTEEPKVKLDSSGNPLFTDAAKTIPDKEILPVVGVDIRGNVYGGGNNADVTGDTHVNIGK